MADNEKIEKDPSIENLRKRSEEEELDSVLKTTIGRGYTKQSVKGYILDLKTLQKKELDNMQKTINSLLVDKDSLQKDSNVILEKYNKISRDYKLLKDSLENSSVGINEIDIDKLKANIASLTESLQTSKNETSKLSSENQLYEQQLKSQGAEVKSMKAQCDVLKKEIANKDGEITMLTTKLSESSNTIELKDKKLDFLKNEVTEGEVGKLKDNLARQISTAGKYKAILESKEKELSEMSKSNDLFKEQIAELRKQMDLINSSIAELTKNNEQLMQKNEALNELVLSSEKEKIKLIGEKLDIEVERNIIARKLDAQNLSKCLDGQQNT